MEHDDIKQDVINEIEAHLAIMESLKKPQQPDTDYIPSPGRIFRIQRTPEEDVTYSNNLYREAIDFGYKAHSYIMKKGRKINTGSIIRKLIAKLLKSNPALKNPELWNKVANKPSRGWTAFDNSQGKYLEGKKANQNMNYERFCNVCGEERKKVKSEKSTG